MDPIRTYVAAVSGKQQREDSPENATFKVFMEKDKTKKTSEIIEEKLKSSNVVAVVSHCSYSSIFSMSLLNILLLTPKFELNLDCKNDALLASQAHKVCLQKYFSLLT